MVKTVLQCFMKLAIKRTKSYFITILGLFLLINISTVIIAGILDFRSSKSIIKTSFSEKNLSTISQVSHLFDVLHAQMIPGLKEASYNNYDIFRLMFANDLTDRELLDGLDDLLIYH